jgi:hypothetical protein
MGIPVVRGLPSPPGRTFRNAMPDGWVYEQAQIVTGHVGLADSWERGYVITDRSGAVRCYAISEPSEARFRRFLARTNG